MKLVLTSDLHGTLPDIPECDLLIIAGDLCPDFIRTFYRNDVRHHKGAPEQGVWVRDTLREWFHRVPAEQIVLIGGNHDFVFESAPALHEGVFSGTKATYLRDAGTTYRDLNIWGVPWCPNLPFWAFYGNDAKLREVYAQVPNSIDVLITHSPPHRYGDKVPDHLRFPTDPPDFDGHVGHPAVNEAVERARPSLVVCGHVHEGYGYYRMPCEDPNMIDVYNVALNTARYEPINPPVVIDL